MTWPSTAAFPKKTYQGYELATREPKLEILLRIAERFEVSTDYLVGRGDKQQVNR
ncbi:MAG: helix-turn-helix domain-containing protein [Christensenellales bacterium]|jgi:transcriptional regulator with XRE-family HTH domain